MSCCLTARRAVRWGRFRRGPTGNLRASSPAWAQRLNLDRVTRLQQFSIVDMAEINLTLRVRDSSLRQHFFGAPLGNGRLIVTEQLTENRFVV